MDGNGRLGVGWGAWLHLLGLGGGEEAWAFWGIGDRGWGEL